MAKSIKSEWDPISPKEWARVLGLVPMPLFGSSQPSEGTSEHWVLLDGQHGSLALSSSSDPDELDDLTFSQTPLSWSWSANLRNTLIIHEVRRLVIVRRWDTQETARLSLPNTPSAALEFFQKLEKTRRRSFIPDVIEQMLKAFRRIRAEIGQYTYNPVDTILVFNAFLTGTEYAIANKIDEGKWRNSATIGDALELLPDQYGQVHASVREVPIGDILDNFLQPDPVSQLVLSPELLIRHASGSLYQEAHFELERSPIQQLSFPGQAQVRPVEGKAKRDARFTPPTLARSIVQQAFDAYGILPNRQKPLEILDPACGSGIFLQEAIRELSARNFRGKVTLRGFDTSEVSCIITRFCLQQAISDASLDTDLVVENIDALINEWGSPDIVLSNPPFANWQFMDPSEQQLVEVVLGDLRAGRPDKAMAFIWKAVQSLGSNGVIGTILPSPFLESSAGVKWREALLEQCTLLFVGKFTGFGYFPGAMVEPAFVVLKRRADSMTQRGTTRVLVASEGAEDRALRMLRQYDSHVTSTDSSVVEIYDQDIAHFQVGNWMPRSKRFLHILEVLDSIGHPRTRNLFDVHLGIRAGHKSAFRLTREQYRQLPAAERKYFRPAAGSSSIRDGRLEDSQYLFYPYGAEGLLLNSETELQAKVNEYFKRYLAPAATELKGRKSLRKNHWWEPSERRPWQFEKEPKIVSKAFGEIGSFAYDDAGTYVVQQGYAWLWNKSNDPHKYDKNIAGNATSIEESDEVEELDETMAPQDFHNSHLPWAYLALLNSRIFEILLSLSCSRVQGGQFDLAPRFVNEVFLPDLSDLNTVPSQAVIQLAEMGRMIAQGKHVNFDNLTRHAAIAYKTPLALWVIDGGERE